MILGDHQLAGVIADRTGVTSARALYGCRQHNAGTYRSSKPCAESIGPGKLFSVLGATNAAWGSTAFNASGARTMPDVMSHFQTGRRRKPMKARSARDGQAETVTTKFDQAIPNIPGKSLVVLEVDYAPGEASPPHTHAKSAFIYAYVVTGKIESKVNDGETHVYRAGESWSEPPNASHPISRNISKTKPAKLLAVFVVDSDDKVLTTPVK